MVDDGPTQSNRYAELTYDKEPDYLLNGENCKWYDMNMSDHLIHFREFGEFFRTSIIIYFSL